MTLGEAVQAARGRLVAAGIAPDEAARDAELLVRHALGWDRATYLTRTREEVIACWHDAYAPLIERRARREPVAYIRGLQEFWGRELLVSPAVLIPRPETELVVEEAITWIGRRNASSGTLLVADVGTGSGCLAITLAAECSDARVFATDISAAALEVATANARRHGVADRITFLHGPYLESLAESVSLIVANPPYVAETDAHRLQPEIVAYEPHEALFGGTDGLRDVHALLAGAAARLVEGGALIMEIGPGQAEDVRRAVSETPGLSLTGLRRDLQGIPRTAVMQRD
ncbi:MAG: peptide chain release factor N(5)-glutamine methyltransferase [Vicinamibacterales bacterium]